MTTPSTPSESTTRSATYIAGSSSRPTWRSLPSGTCYCGRIEDGTTPLDTLPLGPCGKADPTVAIIGNYETVSKREADAYAEGLDTILVHRGWRPRKNP